MMPPELTLRYLTTRTENVTLHVPDAMTYTDLIRLRTPINLTVPFDPAEFDPAQPEGKRSPLSLAILDRYMKLSGEPEAVRCMERLAMIESESLHYHRLTNFIKQLPYAESILIVRLMTTGVFAKMEVRDVVNVMALLFFRKPAKTDAEAISDDFYTPSFSTKDIVEVLAHYSTRYGIPVDFTTPIHRYLYAFCFDGVQYLDFIDELDQLKEWLYILKRGVDQCAPSHNTFVDPTHNVVRQADNVFLAACTRKTTNVVLSLT